MTLLTTVETNEGTVMLLTKTRYLWFLKLPRTSVMPYSADKLASTGVQFQWTTSDAKTLETLHNLLVRVLREGIGLSELRGIADLGGNFMKFGNKLGVGLPFIPDDAPLPTALKAISPYVKQVI
jgi:hypothetical protein